MIARALGLLPGLVITATAEMVDHPHPPEGGLRGRLDVQTHDGSLGSSGRGQAALEGNWRSGLLRRIASD